MPGLIVGTVQYMSPEQIEGKDIDARRSVCIRSVFFEMLSGRRAFEAEQCKRDGGHPRTGAAIPFNGATACHACA